MTKTATRGGTGVMGIIALIALAVTCGLFMVGRPGRFPGTGGPPNRPPGPPAPAAADCFPQAQEPIFVPGIGIAGRGLSGCTEEPIAHYLQVSVEKETASGQWQPVPNVQALTDFTECGEIPVPGSQVLCEHIVACVDGHYRTVVTVVYQDRSGAIQPPVRAPTTPDAHVTC